MSDFRSKSGLPLHPRWQLVKNAELELRKAVTDWVTKYGPDLTYAELLSTLHSALSSELQAMLWSAVRQEREEEDPDGPSTPST